MIQRSSGTLAAATADQIDLFHNRGRGFVLLNPKYMFSVLQGRDRRGDSASSLSARHEKTSLSGPMLGRLEALPSLLWPADAGSTHTIPWGFSRPLL